MLRARIVAYEWLGSHTNIGSSNAKEIILEWTRRGIIEQYGPYHIRVKS